jgi:phosphoserine phosphatase
VITGRIEGKNCHGEQKVIRIQEEYNLSDYQEIYAYGDSSGDKPMLGLATNSFYKPFRSS